MASKMAEDLIDRLKKYKTYLNTHPNGEKVSFFKTDCVISWLIPYK